MKLGILTYHRVINDGSALQAYCAQKMLAGHFPDARVEIIDYMPAMLLRTECRKMIVKRPPFFSFETLAKIKSTNRFVRDYAVLSPSACITDDVKKAERFIKQQNYDAVFVGSDTVWEARYSKYAPPPPNIYYLPGVNHVKKFSLAASADPISPEFISNRKIMASIAIHLKDFDYITVRDQATENYLLQIGVAPGNIHFIPDPTLQYDFSDLINKPDINKSRPWAGVGLGGGVKQAVFSQLMQKGYDIVDLENYTLNRSPIRNALKSINIRLGVYSMLDFLVTDRFHGSIFALKLAGTPVLFVESALKWAGLNSKGRDLFQRLGISPMVWRYDVRKGVPTDLIETYLNIWEKLTNKDLNQKLLLLEEKAANQIGKINSLLIAF